MRNSLDKLTLEDINYNNFCGPRSQWLMELDLDGFLLSEAVDAFDRCNIVNGRVSSRLTSAKPHPIYF